MSSTIFNIKNCFVPQLSEIFEVKVFKMAHFIRKNKVKLGLLTLTLNISESCANTNPVNIVF